MRVLHSRGVWALLIVLTTVAAVGLLRGGRGGDPETNRIAGLIRQLGDNEFAKREEASKELEVVGEKALPALRNAMADSDDLEIRRRARDLISNIMQEASKSRSIGLQLIVIDPGEFSMGSPKAETGRRADESQHKVRITRPFLLGAYEVTQDEYQRVMKTNPSGFQAKGAGKHSVAGMDTSRFPVEGVTWYDAAEFCNRLSKLDGYEPYYQLADVKQELASIKSAAVTLVGGNGYRLPTEAEWEHACRAGTNTIYHFGNDTRSGLINCKPLKIASGYGTALKWPDLGRTAKVGSYPPNGLGLHDMHGNVAEWCGDWYDKDYYDKSPKDDPAGPDQGTHRIQRGGSWMISEGSCRSASRSFHAPDESKDYAGFRVARTPGPPPAGK